MLEVNYDRCYAVTSHHLIIELKVLGQREVAGRWILKTEPVEPTKYNLAQHKTRFHRIPMSSLDGSPHPDNVFVDRADAVCYAIASAEEGKLKLQDELSKLDQLIKDYEDSLVKKATSDDLDTLKINPSFWKVIKHAAWNQDHNVEECQKRIVEGLVTYQFSRTDFIKTMDALMALINEETNTRNTEDTEVCEDHVHYGGDDWHFTDMPSHLISLGEQAVARYLNGGLIDFTPVESFIYTITEWR